MHYYIFLNIFMQHSPSEYEKFIYVFFVVFFFLFPVSHLRKILKSNREKKCIIQVRSIGSATELETMDRVISNRSRFLQRWASIMIYFECNKCTRIYHFVIETVGFIETQNSFVKDLISFAFAIVFRVGSLLYHCTIKLNHIST